MGCAGCAMHKGLQQSEGPQQSVGQFRRWLTSLTTSDESLSEMTTALKDPALRLMRPLRLLGAPLIAEALQTAGGPSDG